MKQLDVIMSVPANIMSFRLTLTDMTSDLDPIEGVVVYYQIS